MFKYLNFYSIHLWTFNLLDRTRVRPLSLRVVAPSRNQTLSRVPMLCYLKRQPVLKLCPRSWSWSGRTMFAFHLRHFLVSLSRKWVVVRRVRVVESHSFMYWQSHPHCADWTRMLAVDHVCLMFKATSMLRRLKLFFEQTVEPVLIIEIASTLWGHRLICGRSVIPNLCLYFSPRFEDSRVNCEWLVTPNLCLYSSLRSADLELFLDGQPHPICIYSPVHAVGT